MTRLESFEALSRNPEYSKDFQSLEEHELESCRNFIKTYQELNKPLFRFVLKRWQKEATMSRDLKDRHGLMTILLDVANHFSL